MSQVEEDIRKDKSLVTFIDDNYSHWVEITRTACETKFHSSRVSFNRFRNLEQNNVSPVAGPTVWAKIAVTL